MEEKAATSTPSASDDVISSSSSSVNGTKIDKVDSLQQALNYLVQGKRHLLVKDIGSAIVSLGESCQILSETNGPLSSDNAEAHFYYGTALLEQSRLDLAVFEGGVPAEKDASDGEDDESDDDENNAESGETSEKDEIENEAEAEPQQSAEKEETTEIAPEKEDSKKEEDLNSPSPNENVVQDSEKPSTSSGLPAEGVNGEKEGEEELSNLELAWEVLEVAKIGYSSQLKLVVGELGNVKTDEEKTQLLKSKAHLQKRLSETHSLLGEVATESENYVQAVEDFKMAIEILSEVDGPDSREIAQYYFQMGLAFSFAKKFQEGINSFKKAKEIIGNRIDNLKYKIENKQTAKDLGKVDDAEYSEQVEISELKALLPELEEKVNDTIDAERENQATLEEEVKEKEIEMKNSPVKNPNPPAVNDISHLVKKKKKAEESLPEVPPSKRICNENDDIGISVSAPTEEVTSSNGHAK